MRKKRKKAPSRAKRHIKPEKLAGITPKEHVRKISYAYEDRAKKIDFSRKEGFTHPLGIKVLAGYLFILLGFYFFYLFVGIKSPIAVIFGQVIGGLNALFLVMFLIIVTITLIAGLLKRKKWSYYLALAWFSFGIANSLISLILLQPQIASFTRSFLVLSSVTVFVIDILAILYIASEKNYFFAGHFIEKSTRVVDKVFVVALIIFLVITISIGSALGYDFYITNIQQTDSLISELDGKTYEEQTQICSLKQDQQRDLCMLILSIKTGSKDLCSQISSDFYKLSCMQA